MSSPGLIILAAGASTRLGEPKQQLLYKGTTLLHHTIEVAVNSGCYPIAVVLGAHSEKIALPSENVDILIINNPEWAEGMASSIRYGLKAVLELRPDLEAIIIMACDQPFVTTGLLQNLIQTQQYTQQPIVACAYQDTVGVPVLLKQSFFSHLLALTGQSGAKKLLLQHPEKVATVPFAMGHIDIDTPADYAALQQQTPNEN